MVTQRQRRRRRWTREGGVYVAALVAIVVGAVQKRPDVMTVGVGLLGLPGVMRRAGDRHGDR